MALQICQFVANHSLAGLPANRILFLGNNPNTKCILPNNKNVLIKKIAVDCIYNQQSEVIVINYFLNLRFEHYDLRPIVSNHFRAVNNSAFDTATPIIMEFNKLNPLIECNFIAGAFDVSAIGSNNFISLGLGGLVSSNISFLITIYYENIDY